MKNWRESKARQMSQWVEALGTLEGVRHGK